MTYPESKHMREVRENVSMFVKCKLRNSAFCNEDQRYLDELEEKLVSGFLQFIINEKANSYLKGVLRKPELI